MRKTKMRENTAAAVMVLFNSRACFTYLIRGSFRVY